MILKLPYPISANRYWRTFRNHTVVSAEAKKFKAQVMSDNYPMKPYDGDVQLTIEYHPKTNKDGRASKTMMDLDNVMKVTLDALKGIAYNDDKQVKKITAWIAIQKNGGGLTVVVQPYIGIDR